MGCSERKKEIRRRRHRVKKLKHYKSKLETANASDKQAIANKLWRLTPGAAVINANLGIG